MNRQSWLRKNITSLLILLLVIAITSAIFFSYQNFPDKFSELKHFGYLGAFVISLLLNATVILPVGNFIILFTLGGMLPLPIVVGLAGGAGAAFGEITGYMAGYSGHGLIKKSRLYNRMEGWVTKWGAAAIFIFSLFPFAFDLAGIAAGVLRFPFRKFLLLCWLGRTILYIIIALAGAWGWEAILPYLS